MKFLLSLLAILFTAVVVVGRDKANPIGRATFAGGCFWCMEAPFKAVEGVVSVTSGYTGGREKNPTYEQVSSGRTGHVEAVQIVYDENKVSYDTLLDIFWRQIDPTDDGGQFADRGPQYRTAIFYHDDAQRRLAEASLKRLRASGRFKAPIVTRIREAAPFYEAEPYHQNFFQTNPVHYKSYKKGSGRQDFIDRTWETNNAGNAAPEAPDPPSPEQRKKELSPLQFHVTQEKGTERPFENPYWDNKRDGIYIDVVSHEPLFSSRDKFDSGTGWPSFSKPLDPANVVEVEDTAHGMERVEVRSRGGDSHLGHVFDDGPQPTGERYCINSASLIFVPVEELDAYGLSRYKALFEN